MTIIDRIICALDASNFSKVDKIIRNIEHDIIYKVGMEFFYSFGMEGILKLKEAKKNIKIFLDLKLHDIPNTVSSSLIPLILNIKPYMLTVHVTGGMKMMEEVMHTVNKISKKNFIKPPLIFGVTVLTSLDKLEVENLGWDKNIKETVIKYALLAKKANLNGIVCSALETKKVKEVCGADFKVITPGIRLNINNKQDQARVVTPKQAFKDGSDYIVMGRPIINSKNPNKIIEDILNTIYDEK